MLIHLSSEKTDLFSASGRGRDTREILGRISEELRLAKFFEKSLTFQSLKDTQKKPPVFQIFSTEAAVCRMRKKQNNNSEQIYESFCVEAK